MQGTQASEREREGGACLATDGASSLVYSLVLLFVTCPRTPCVPLLLFLPPDSWRSNCPHLHAQLRPEVIKVLLLSSAADQGAQPHPSVRQPVTQLACRCCAPTTLPSAAFFTFPGISCLRRRSRRRCRRRSRGGGERESAEEEGKQERVQSLLPPCVTDVVVVVGADAGCRCRCCERKRRERVCMSVSERQKA